MNVAGNSANNKVKMLDSNYYTVETGGRGGNLAQKTFKATHGARSNYNGSVMQQRSDAHELGAVSKRLGSERMSKGMSEL